MESHKIHAPKHQPDLAPGSSTFHELEQNMKHQIIHPDLLDGFYHVLFNSLHPVSTYCGWLRNPAPVGYYWDSYETLQNSWGFLMG